MGISRRIGRPLLASIFVFDGLEAARHPETKVEKAEPVAQPLVQMAPGPSVDTETLVKANGILQIVAGLALAVGKFRRLAALALIGSIIPTTLADHRFWEETEDEARAAQQTHFLKNLGLLGGLILAAVDTEGAPSLGWRAKRRARSVSHAVSVGGAIAGSKVDKVTRRGRKARDAATKITPAALATAREQAKRSIATAGAQLHTGADMAGRLISTVPDRTSELVTLAKSALPIG